MSSSRPGRRLLAATAILFSIAALLLHACHDKPTEPTSPDAALDASRGANRPRLTVNGTGSTVAGTVTSNRGGISCSISVANGVASTSGTCSAQYKAKAVVTLHAVPSPGNVFSAWVGCTATSDDPTSCQVPMTADVTVSAVFKTPASSFLLTVAGGAGGNGAVRSTPAGINCTITGGSAGTMGCSASFPTGTSVTLAATAASGFYLKAWAGGGCDAAGTGAGTAGGSCAVPLTQALTVTVSFSASAVQAALGEWGAPFTWPAVAIHAHLLPNGTVMTWGRMDHDPVTWDPASPGTFGTAARPADFFCSGHALLPDGRLLVAGGHNMADNYGLRTTYLYDFATNSWTRGPDMQNGRWYPNNVTLANGDLLTMSGGDTAAVLNTIPEVWQTSTGSWRALAALSLSLPYYPMSFVAPDGRVFVAGPNAATVYVNPAGTGAAAAGPSHVYTGDRSYGSAAMYDAGKILVVGGGAPTATAEVIDLNAGAGATWRSVGSLALARRQTNATLLADGTVLVTGGTNASGFNTAPTNSGVLAAERWDPATERFTTLARMSHYRLYHSTALLLPDARILSVGSGQPAASGLTDDYTAEVFSPPYLYRPDGTLAPRPTITNAPVSVGYGQSFTVETPNAAAIARVTSIRLSSVTHAFNMNQRMNRLAFSVTGATSLSVTAPASGALAPPGHYMLFLVDSSGVPSVARTLRIF